MILITLFSKFSTRAAQDGCDKTTWSLNLSQPIAWGHLRRYLPFYISYLTVVFNPPALHRLSDSRHHMLLQEIPLPCRLPGTHLLSTNLFQGLIVIFWEASKQHLYPGQTREKSWCHCDLNDYYNTNKISPVHSKHWSKSSLNLLQYSLNEACYCVGNWYWRPQCSWPIGCSYCTLCNNMHAILCIATKKYIGKQKWTETENNTNVS